MLLINMQLVFISGRLYRGQIKRDIDQGIGITKIKCASKLIKKEQIR